MGLVGAHGAAVRLLLRRQFVRTGLFAVWVGAADGGRVLDLSGTGRAMRLPVQLQPGRTDDEAEDGVEHGRGWTIAAPPVQYGSGVRVGQGRADDIDNESCAAGGEWYG